MDRESRPLLLRAPFVVPVTSPLIEDGGVVVAAGRIVAVGRFQELHREGWPVVACDGILTPGLINCHAHLELSHLAGVGAQAVTSSGGDMTAWIRRLLRRRGEAVPVEVIVAAGRQALAEQHRRGVALVADIGNLALSSTIGQGAATEQLFFRELLAANARAVEALLATLAPDETCTVHAPYSCHPVLIKAVKARTRQVGGLFPIHLAESVDEITWLRTGEGPFRDFLVERLTATGALAPGQALADLLPSPGCGAVAYLHGLGCLDERTICVHVVHIEEAEAAMIAVSSAKVCLCPGSNRTLGVGTAPVPMLIRHGILPGLGTDSLASNASLDLWEEMRLLQEDHPSLDPGSIFRFATLGGAQTLGVSHRLGALAPGLAAKLLVVPFVGSANDVYPYLVSGDATIVPRWQEVGL